MPREPLELARSIGDRFVRWQGASGRPDPETCPFVTRKPQFYPPNTHCTAPIARALYRLADRTGETGYKESADRYAIFSFAYPRDPVAPWSDPQKTLWLQRAAERPPNTSCATFQYGLALDPAWTEFRRHNPGEDCFDARADSLFDWIQRRRTDRGQAYDLGYAPTDPNIPDWAFTDDLRLIGSGLIGYYEETGRQSALEAALRLGDYYLRAHQPGTAEGAFLPDLGTWCIGPWPPVVSVEHLTEFRLDQNGWGWSARGAVEFLARVHAALPPNHPRAALMQDRCIRSVRWQFGCRFPEGAVGLCGQDDHWLGMTAGALLALADVRRAGWSTAELEQELGPAIAQARAWLLQAATEDFLDAGGYRKVTGRSSPTPPDNLACLLAWTVESLLRWDESEPM